MGYGGDVYMLFKELLEKINTLPINVKNDNEVSVILKEVLDSYSVYVDSLFDFPFAEKIKNINKIILNTVDYYYNGMPNQAYLEVKNFLQIVQ